MDPKIARKYSLQNAILHDGKAEVSAVLRKVLAEDPSLKTRIKEIVAELGKVVEGVNRLTLEEQRGELEALAPGLLERGKVSKPQELPPLQKVGKTVVMRLAPYPSGPLHIGNARMVILNDEYVRRYGGRLILMFDDTIGSGEKSISPEAYDQIKDGLDWLGVECHEVHYKSDRLDIFYEWAEKLIMADHAYCCECPPERLRALRERGEACEHRSLKVEDNIVIWRRMVDGAYGEGGAVLRLRTEMDHPNPAFRDRVLFRVSEREHPRVGRRYKVWPMLEFSWAVDDNLLGITHVLRGKDLIIEDEMERTIWDYLGIARRPEFVHYGILFFKDMELSKSKYRLDIKEGRISGIDDPRTWTLQSLRRRGIEPSALRIFMLSFGLSMTDIEVPAENLYSENRRLIDDVANRYFFVPSPVDIEIEGMPEIVEASVPLHPDHPERGHRKLRVSDRLIVPSEDFEEFVGAEIRFKDLFNVQLGKRARFTSRELKDLPKIQWLSEGVPMEVVMPDGSVVEGSGEPALTELEVGTVVQLERFGFVRIDKKEPTLTAYFAHR